MPSSLIFKDAEKARDAICAEDQKKIRQLYSDWADEVGKRAEYYRSKETASSYWQEQQMLELQRQLTEQSKVIANQIYTGTKGSMYTVADSVVGCNAKYLSELGFPSDGVNRAFTSVPTQVVNNLVTGQIYEGGWNLSSAIWSDNEQTLHDIYQIVAQGRAMNMSAYEVSKMLEQYVNPNKAKQWNLTMSDGRRIYKRSVDYNAQRLTRTLTQHAYQQGIIQCAKDNPFIQTIIWRANGSRTCELCLDRDGKEYRWDEVPMDHPNGMCTMEPKIDMDKTIDQLADWFNAEDGEYPEIDAFANKFGYVPTSGKTPAFSNSGTIFAPNQFQTQGYVGLSGKESDQFMQQYHNEELLTNGKRVNDGVGESSGHIVNAGFNERVRQGTVTVADKQIMRELDGAIASNSLPQDMTLYRGAGYKTIPGLDPRGKTKEQIVEELRSKTGEVIKPSNYVQVSASSERNYFTDSDISMQILAPEGTPAYISAYQAESEIVLGRDTAFEIVGADIVENVKDVFGMNAGDRITLIVKIVPLK